MQISDRIKEFIIKELMHENNLSVIAKEESLLDRGVLDSLGLLHVVTFLEKEFNLTVRDQDMTPENFQSIDAISDLVERRRKDASR